MDVQIANTNNPTVNFSQQLEPWKLQNVLYLLVEAVENQSKSEAVVAGMVGEIETNENLARKITRTTATFFGNNFHVTSFVRDKTHTRHAIFCAAEQPNLA